MAAYASSFAPHCPSGPCPLPEAECPPWRVSCCFLCADPVSRKNVKSAHSTRNRYSSQWTLTKCQASTPARTLTSDWRTVGSQHGVTVTESDSYSASLSQDTGEPGAQPASCSLSPRFSTIRLPCPNLHPPALGVQGTGQCRFQVAHRLAVQPAQTHLTSLSSA